MGWHFETITCHGLGKVKMRQQRFWNHLPIHAETGRWYETIFTNTSDCWYCSTCIQITVTEALRGLSISLPSIPYKLTAASTSW